MVVLVLVRVIRLYEVGAGRSRGKGRTYPARACPTSNTMTFPFAMCVGRLERRGKITHNAHALNSLNVALFNDKER